ncbi:alcohol dehydrogenase class IV [Clostridium acetobutylicum]|uniref:iron-containing alcohol dehydrogenase n=1 Tax=Clostridium TaxID=1485 RepID=UPI000200C5BE|nr:MULTISPECIES: iron-containing alcohol dehydrogenase [Clostridium]ADZ22841.1 Alcohol dehydrogenase [Clostridium acetobutylicum EA 2018]AEI34801.1 alcohol dehydrogenase [Clostridium acetobutylicum DSM 1731]AWV82350.1 iron-containing alcohol dehydrogenase [Clostridium acetobutylicum]NOV90746.1 alcohol dehydrogenase class IV [Clostridium acetobutylicum]NOW16564.1 alcohol dehydrogenase class IV [Clostridium acetobutylicum]
MKNTYYRLQQYMFSKAQRLLPWRMPNIISGSKSICKLPYKVKNDGVKKVLVITTAGSIKRGSLNEMFDELKKENISYVIYDDVQPDPTIECIEAVVKFYKKEACEGIIAVGGGSVMDCAKVTGARIVKPKKSVSQMAGLMKIRKELPPLYTVPTTAGTGSETTVAAVVTDSSTHLKYAVSDLCLIPKYAVLDPELTCGLPKNLTAITGMDALTHAVEAYTNKYSSKESRKYALDAVKLIFENLKKAYDNGKNIEVRENMLKASYYAGVAFTRSYVGYVHAIAHAVGGLYGVPHGMANAVILPVVLEAYGEAIYKNLAELADATSVPGKTQMEKAKNFILSIRKMNQSMEIPDKLDSIKKEDIPEIINRAMKEANPSYPVPVIWDKIQFEKVVESLK